MNEEIENKEKKINLVMHCIECVNKKLQTYHLDVDIFHIQSHTQNQAIFSLNFLVHIVF